MLSSKNQNDWMMNKQSADNSPVSIRSVYLGASKVESSVFEDAVAALQDVLTKYMPGDSSSLSGHSIILTLSSDGIDLNYDDNAHTRLFLPIKYLIYCGAFKKLSQNRSDKTLVFKTLNQIPTSEETYEPPLVAVVFKGIGNFISHIFTMQTTDQALLTVNTMMRNYYAVNNPSQTDGILNSIFKPSEFTNPQQFGNNAHFVQTSSPVHSNPKLAFERENNAYFTQHGSLFANSNSVAHPNVNASDFRSFQPANNFQNVQGYPYAIAPNPYSSENYGNDDGYKGYTIKFSDGQIITPADIAADPHLQKTLKCLNQIDPNLSTTSSDTNSDMNESFENTQNCRSSEDQSQNQNVIIRWLQAPSPSSNGDPVLVREEIRSVNPEKGIHILNEQMKAKPTSKHNEKILIQNNESCNDSSSPPIVIIERWLPSEEQSKKSNKVLIPITVNEMRLVKPNPVVIEHMHPIFRTRRRVKKAIRSPILGHPI